MKLLKKIKNTYIGGKTMMINYFAMQIELGWITIEAVPKRFRKQVQELLDFVTRRLARRRTRLIRLRK